jgi:pyrimidine operon attenuation protein/uracil phosphoribosyltransferase
MPEKILMTAEDIRRTLARIAHEIIERNKVMEGLILVGLHTRGVPLARRLAKNIELYEKSRLIVGALDFSLHRDDLSPEEASGTLQHTDIPSDIKGKSVVLVDDVLYTGRTIRAAMDAGEAAVDTARHAYRPRPPRDAHPRGLRGEKYTLRPP